MRILVLAAILVAIEGAVFLFGYVTPALAGLMRPVYWVVALCPCHGALGTAARDWRPSAQRPERAELTVNVERPSRSLKQQRARGYVLHGDVTG